MANENKKKSMLLFYHYEEWFDDLTDEEVGQIIRAMFRYECDGEDTEFDDRMMTRIFRDIKKNLDNGKIEYGKTCERNKANGKKGGRKSKNETHNNPVGFCGLENQEETENETQNNPIKDIGYRNKDIITTTTCSNNKDSVGSCCDESFGKVFSAVEKEFGRPISPIESERIKEWVENHNEDLVLHALKTAIIHDKRSFSYIGGILKNWKDNDIRSVYEAEAAGERFKTTKNSAKVGGASHNGINFDEVYAI